MSAAGAGYVLLLEGTGLNFYPEPAEHRHRCPECFDDWSHRDEDCAADATPDPWHANQSAGYATCPACAAPGSNGSAWVFCLPCGAVTLADLAGAPACCGVIPEGDTGYVNDPSRGWEVAL